MSTNPNLDDYIAFFGSEPIRIHEDGWYHGAQFIVRRENEQLDVSIFPDDAELDIEWQQAGRRRLSMKLKMAVNWKIETRNSVKNLLVRVNTGSDALCSFENLILRLDPIFDADWEMSWDPGWDPSSAPEFLTN